MVSMGGFSTNRSRTACRAVTRAIRCGPQETPIYNKAKEIRYQQKGDQLVLSLEGVSRSLPWKAVRTPASEDPIDCEGGPCPVAFDLRLKEGVLLVISQGDIVSQWYRYVIAPVQQLDEKRSQILNEVGFAAHKKGDYETSVALFTEAVILDRKNLTATFNTACAYARLGKAAQAVAFLEALPDAAEARKKARSDKDFDGIRTSPELQKFLGAAAD
jgi:tetratricopeptide (TPR) repeat protein